MGISKNTQAQNTHVNTNPGLTGDMVQQKQDGFSVNSLLRCNTNLYPINTGI
jgi:hypothetical protein